MLSTAECSICYHSEKCKIPFPQPWPCDRIFPPGVAVQAVAHGNCPFGAICSYRAQVRNLPAFQQRQNVLETVAAISTHCKQNSGCRRNTGCLYTCTHMYTRGECSPLGHKAYKIDWKKQPTSIHRLWKPHYGTALKHMARSQKVITYTVIRCFLFLRIALFIATGSDVCAWHRKLPSCSQSSLAFVITKEGEGCKPSISLLL